MKEIVKAYKYRIYPTKKQKELIHKTFGCCRFVYNFCRAWQKKEEDRWFLVKELRQQGYPLNDYHSKYFNKYESIKFISELKKYYPWLKEVDNTALQSTIEHLANAYDRYYKGQGDKPKFKSKKNSTQSYTSKCNKTNLGGTIRIIGSSIKLPKLGSIKFKDKSRPKGRIVNATISKTSSNKYYVSLTCQEVYVEDFPKTKQNIGIDLGLTHFATLSDGTKIANVHFYERLEQKIIKLQKELSRKQIEGSNWKKVKLKLARLYEKITNQRKDFMHKLTTNLIKVYDIICIENLDVSTMKETDSKIRNKRVSDVSWYEFKRQLQYKCKWYGKTLSIVNRYYPSSQICSVCGHKDGKKELFIREWECPQCHSLLDRDINASRNILNEGLRILV